MYFSLQFHRITNVTHIAQDTGKHIRKTNFTLYLIFFSLGVASLALGQTYVSIVRMSRGSDVRLADIITVTL